MTSELIRVNAKGQDIIDAVKKIAKEPVVNQDYINGKDVFIVGQKSSYPYENLLVTADGNKEIDPSANYSEITITKHGWGGSVFAVGYGQDAVIKTIKDFAQKLKNELPKKEAGEKLKIFKYEISGKSRTSFEMPQGAKFFDKGIQGDEKIACLWFLVNPDNPPETRNFIAVTTGEPFTADVAKLQPIGTFDDGNYVFHVFEELN